MSQEEGDALLAAASDDVEEIHSPPSREEPARDSAPLTPMSNFKMLIDAASTVQEEEGGEGGGVGGGGGEENSGNSQGSGGGVAGSSGGRKMKSLTLLCKKFLTIMEENGTGKEFSLDMMSKSLGINRRRIYDIINVLEALEMISKQSKNWYIWLGRENLLSTLAKLKAMAMDDPDFQQLLLQSENKENMATLQHTPVEHHKALDYKLPSSHTKILALSSSPPLPPLPLPLPPPPHFTPAPPAASGPIMSPPPPVPTTSIEGVKDEGRDESGVGGDSGPLPSATPVSVEASDYSSRLIRQDKSLGMLCQKFVMLFLVAPNNEVTLEVAGCLLVSEGMDTGPSTSSTNSFTKTKVRRLYDIANILMSLDLVRKQTFMGPNHTKRPGYSWCGPPIKEIDLIPVLRHTDFSVKQHIQGHHRHPSEASTSDCLANSKPALAAISGGGGGGWGREGAAGVRGRGVPLTRRASFGGRPFLHQYEVQGVKQQYSSAPSLSLSHKKSFKRSLSFGATPTATPPPPSGPKPSGASSAAANSTRVTARPLCPKQLDYMSELREFEAEIQKNSQRFPNVAPVFREFVQRYQSTLEQASSTGHTLLPCRPYDHAHPTTPPTLDSLMNGLLPLSSANAPPESTSSPKPPPSSSPSPFLPSTPSPLSVKQGGGEGGQHQHLPATPLLKAHLEGKRSPPAPPSSVAGLNRLVIGPKGSKRPQQQQQVALQNQNRSQLSTAAHHPVHVLPPSPNEAYLTSSSCVAMVVSSPVTMLDELPASLPNSTSSVQSMPLKPMNQALPVTNCNKKKRSESSVAYPLEVAKQASGSGIRLPLSSLVNQRPLLATSSATGVEQGGTGKGLGSLFPAPLSPLVTPPPAGITGATATGVGRSVPLVAMQQQKQNVGHCVADPNVFLRSNTAPPSLAAGEKGPVVSPSAATFALANSSLPFHGRLASFTTAFLAGGLGTLGGVLSSTQQLPLAVSVAGGEAQGIVQKAEDPSVDTVSPPKKLRLE